MQSDEQLYELVAKELATSPRQGLLIKCMAKSDGEENKGKALYIETRVDEMKKEIAEEIKTQKVEEGEFKFLPTFTQIFQVIVIAAFVISSIFAIIHVISAF